MPSMYVQGAARDMNPFPPPRMECAMAVSPGSYFVCATQSKSCRAFSTMSVMESRFERFLMRSKPDEVTKSLASRKLAKYVPDSKAVSTLRLTRKRSPRWLMYFNCVGFEVKTCTPCVVHVFTIIVSYGRPTTAGGSLRNRRCYIELFSVPDSSHMPMLLTLN